MWIIATIILCAVCFALGYVVPEPKWVARAIAKAKEKLANQRL